MEGLTGFLRQWFVKFKWILTSKKWERYFYNRSKELHTDINSLVQVLEKEQEKLIKEFKKEEEPIKKYRFLTGILEIEAEIEKCRILMKQHKS